MATRTRAGRHPKTSVGNRSVRDPLENMLAEVVGDAWAGFHLGDDPELERVTAITAAVYRALQQSRLDLLRPMYSKAREVLEALPALPRDPGWEELLDPDTLSQDHLAYSRSDFKEAMIHRIRELLKRGRVPRTLARHLTRMVASDPYGVSGDHSLNIQREIERAVSHGQLRLDHRGRVRRDDGAERELILCAFRGAGVRAEIRKGFFDQERKRAERRRVRRVKP